MPSSNGLNDKPETDKLKTDIEKEKKKFKGRSFF